MKMNARFLKMIYEITLFCGLLPAFIWVPLLSMSSEIKIKRYVELESLQRKLGDESLDAEVAAAMADDKITQWEYRRIRKKCDDLLKHRIKSGFADSG
jgi:hypothetical protein